MAADRLGVRATEGAHEQLGRRIEVARQIDTETLGIGGQLLVAELECVALSSCGEVAPPDPCRPPRVACSLELGSPVGLDPEPCVRAVADARIVGLGALAAKPGLLEERADDIASVAHDVYDARLGVREWDRPDEERQLGGLLDWTDGADEPDAARDGEDPAEARRGFGRCKRGELRYRGLHRGHLPEVDEAGKRADRAREKGGARPRGADDEDEPVVESPEALPERRASPRRQSLRHAQLVRGRFEEARHGSDCRSGWRSRLTRPVLLIESAGTSLAHPSAAEIC